MSNQKSGKNWSITLEEREEKIIVLFLVLGNFLLPVNSGLHLSSSGVLIMWPHIQPNQQELLGFFLNSGPKEKKKKGKNKLK